MKKVLIVLALLALAVAMALTYARLAHGQEVNVRTVVRCGGGPEHTINFVPVSRSGQRVATCRPDQKETWYDNATTTEWRQFTDGKHVFAIRISYADQSYEDQWYGPVPAVALEELHHYPGGGGVPHQLVRKAIGGELTVLNARKLKDVLADLDAGKEGR